MIMRSRRALYLRDGDGEILEWLEAVAEDQRRRHPGRRPQATAASVAREALAVVRSSPDIQEKLRR